MRACLVCGRELRDDEKPEVLHCADGIAYICDGPHYRVQLIWRVGSRFADSGIGTFPTLARAVAYAERYVARGDNGRNYRVDVRNLRDWRLHTHRYFPSGR